jgi:protein TonB
MKKQSQKINNAGQSSIEVRKSQKHEVNLQKNSTLYFQIGLILCLLGTFALFEMEFESKVYKPVVAKAQPTEIDYAVDKFKVYEPKAKVEPKQKAPSEKIIDKIKEVDNTVTNEEKKLFTSEEKPTTNKPINPEDLGPIIEEPTDIHVNMVEFVPIFPGCEKYELNSERKKCLNEKMNRLVKRKFNSDIANGYGLSGVQRIFVNFKVDKTGNITDIQTRAPHPKLEKEALKVANKIPKMTPGKMGTSPVNVLYTLPITFKVEN